MSDFDASKAFQEARERGEHAEKHGARWVPIAAAIIAVIAAIANLVASQRSTIALTSKNEALRQTTLASDAYNEYESRSIKQHIYEADIASGIARDPAKLQAVADHEKEKGKPVLAKAHRFEQGAEAANERSEHYLKSYETLEIGVTFFEIAIVLVSISALATTRVLTVVAAVATIAGFVISIIGALLV
ncbi:MAG: hypothetical protein NVSMB64_14700 [Candidatus Velthaea sp.]